MKIEINLVFCALVVLTGSSQTIGQKSPLPPVLTTVALPRQAGTSASPVLPVDAGDDVTQRTSTKTPTATTAGGIAQSETVPDAVHRNKLVATTSRVTTFPRTAVPSVMTVNPAAPDSPSSIPTLQRSTPLGRISTPYGSTHPTGDPHTTSTPPPSAPSSRDTTPAQPSSQPRSESLTPAPTQPPTTSRPQTSTPVYAPAGPTHSEVPSELNVGDKDFKGPHHQPSSPLDPLLAGLVSVFIVTTAIISVVLFLKFRQRTNHPEFHRLQDLPMDDLMEDTPLSRYTY